MEKIRKTQQITHGHTMIYWVLIIVTLTERWFFSSYFLSSSSAPSSRCSTFPHSPPYWVLDKGECTGVNKTQNEINQLIRVLWEFNMKRTYCKGFEGRINNNEYCYLPSRAKFEIIWWTTNKKLVTTQKNLLNFNVMKRNKFWSIQEEK